MSVHSVGVRAPDDAPVSFSGGRLRFRGPAPDLNRPVAAFVGGSDTYGAGVDDPFANRVARTLGLQCLNLGVPQAGPGVMLNEPQVLELTKIARHVVLQLPSVRNVSTEFVQVHPRRNDRIVRILPALHRAVPGQNWVNVHFTGHLDQILADRAPQVYAALVKARSRLWLGQMRAILAQLPSGTIILSGPEQTVLAQSLNVPIVTCVPKPGENLHQVYADAILGQLT